MRAAYNVYDRVARNVDAATADETPEDADTDTLPRMPDYLQEKLDRGEAVGRHTPSSWLLRFVKLAWQGPVPKFRLVVENIETV